MGADVVFALTEGQNGKYDRNNATLVSVGPIVPAFSTMEAAKEGYKSMENRLKANGKTMVFETGTFLELARSVDKMGATLLLDPNKAGKGISYTNGRIESCFILGSGNIWKIPDAKSLVYAVPLNSRSAY